MAHIAFRMRMDISSVLHQPIEVTANSGHQDEYHAINAGKSTNHDLSLTANHFSLKILNLIFSNQ